MNWACYSSKLLETSCTFVRFATKRISWIWPFYRSLKLPSNHWILKGYKSTQYIPQYIKHMKGSSVHLIMCTLRCGSSWEKHIYMCMHGTLLVISHLHANHFHFNLHELYIQTYSTRTKRQVYACNFACLHSLRTCETVQLTMVLMIKTRFGRLDSDYHVYECMELNLKLLQWQKYDSWIEWDGIANEITWIKRFRCYAEPFSVLFFFFFVFGNYDWSFTLKHTNSNTKSVLKDS